MKPWTTGILLALGGIFPALGSAQGPWDAPGVQQGGYHQQVLSGPTDPQSWHSESPAGYAGYEQLLPDRGILYDTDSCFDLSLRETLARTWIRLDYLLWDISDGHNTLLGAPTASGANPLPAIDPIEGQRSQTLAIVPRLGSTGQDLNGIRGSIGIPTLLGSLEADVWALQKSEELISILPVVNSQSPGNPITTIGAVTLLNDGVQNDNRMILFSEDYLAKMQTTLWGTEANWVFNPFTPNVPLEVSPILGIRFIRLEDSLRISGTDISTSNDPTTLNHVIASLARNNIFGPQIGLRFQTQANRLELGTEAKFIIGINALNEKVHTEEIFNTSEPDPLDPTAPVEPDQTDKGLRTRFAPILDLSVYGRLHVTERFSLLAGYEFMIGGGFSRAYDNINYNSPSNLSDPPTIGLDPHLSKFVVQGLTVGGELVFR